LILEYNGSNLISNGILYFYSAWLSDCSVAKNNIIDISIIHKDITIQKINVTKYYKLKKYYNVKVIPSLILINNDKLMSKLDGISNKLTINNWIKENTK
jgi:hypothetical protein